MRGDLFRSRLFSFETVAQYLNVQTFVVLFQVQCNCDDCNDFDDYGKCDVDFDQETFSLLAFDFVALDMVLLLFR